ncbi:60S acidic ribosomal protein P1-alpha 3 [Aphanomyces cochlioides]|nr:60S acidic ribosomal protein P1-alpha 3 [Aphanomyces cochlioides]
MSDAATAPRVNKAIMAQFVGRTVALVGSLESWTGSMAVVKTSDGGLVTVHPQPGADYSRYRNQFNRKSFMMPCSKFVEVIGLVQPDGSLKEYKCTSFGDDFDLKNYDKLVHLIHGKFSSLFA